MELLKVTAILSDGRICTSDGFLPLDGILQYAYAKKYRPELLEKPLNSYDCVEIFDLPLAKVGDGTDNWYFNTSFAMFQILAEDRQFINKRYDTHHAEKYADFGKRTSNLNLQAGRFKNWRIPLNILLTNKIEWCCVGHKAEIELLLKEITHIGKKTAIGIGKVSEWVVEDAQEDLTHLRPVPDADGYDYMAIRPLYHDPKNIKLVKMPSDARLGANAIYEVR